MEVVYIEMIIKCAWCGKVTDDKPPYGGKYDREITHGICKDYEEKWLGSSKKDEAKG